MNLYQLEKLLISTCSHLKEEDNAKDKALSRFLFSLRLNFCSCLKYKSQEKAAHIIIMAILCWFKLRTILMKLTFITPTTRRVLNMFSFKLHTSPFGEVAVFPFFRRSYQNTNGSEGYTLMDLNFLIRYFFFQSKVTLSSKAHLSSPATRWKRKKKMLVPHVI